MGRYLINFGDSWAHGEASVRDFDLYYAAQLSALTARKLIDLSQPSTSVSHMILQFQRFIQEYYQPGNDYLAIFFITAQERQLAFDTNGIPQEIHPSKLQYCSYYKSVYTDHLGKFILNTSILSLQAMSKHYQIDDRYLLGWQQPTLWPEINVDRFYRNAETNAITLLGAHQIENLGRDNNPNFIENNGHPSAKGHTKIAQALNQWLTTDFNPV